MELDLIDLLDERKCEVYLDHLTDILRSPSRMITASQFSKRYAVCLLAPALYAMTMNNKELDVAIEQCLLESSVQNGLWQPKLHLTEAQVSGPHEAGRCHWRDEIIQRLFFEHLNQLWDVFSKVAKVPRIILWENTAVRIISLYQKKMVVGADVQDKLRIQEDFEYLMMKAPAVLFGEKETENPLTKFYDPNCSIRKTCCFYYDVSPEGEYCINCPKLKKNPRRRAESG